MTGRDVHVKEEKENIQIKAGKIEKFYSIATKNILIARAKQLNQRYS